MGRNLDRRIETLVPISDPALVRHLHDGILRPYLDDTTRAWEMQANGSYVRRVPTGGAAPFSAQDWLLSHPSTAGLGFGARSGNA